LALYYLETSALVKLYIRERGTDTMIQLASNAADNRFAVLVLSHIEFRSAIRRRERDGDIDPRMASMILDQFHQHAEVRFFRQVVNDVVLEGAAEMIDRYALRAYDAFQLAACLALKSTSGADVPSFVCSDHQLLEAARSELLLTLDPCTADL
jgi:predicted nucleic acid-binding protein